ncbi:MAG: HEAT repeat domain-containing protein [Gemmatimonadota bacterium]
MRAVSWSALAVALVSSPMAGQSLAQRVTSAPDGEVRIAFAARDGVCGDGRTFIRDRTRGHGEGDFITYNSDDSHWSGRAKNWRERACVDGPVRVAFRVRDGMVRSARTYVGGDWPSPLGTTTDLGTVAARQAVDGLFALAKDSRNSGSDDLIFPPTLADSVTTWPALLAIARDDRAPRRSRSSAVFWLSQQAGDAATKGLTDLVDDDSEDREIREQAVFGLSQLPKDQGVPVLMRAARTNRDPGVRRKALFWLGQSDDPRVLAFFEEILRK